MRVTVLLLAAILLGSCNDAQTYTLYSNSLIIPEMRVHVATFDAADGDDYNRGNCNIASELFKNQPGVTVKYWCEKGRYRS